MSEQPKTSTGLEQNIAAMLSYILGIFTGILFIILEKDNKFVRFHAFQSIFVSAFIMILSMVITMIPFLGILIGFLITPLSFILWIVLLVKSYQGAWFKLPFIGDLAEKQVQS